MILNLMEWFIMYAYAQIAASSLFFAVLHVYAFWVRGRPHFLSELVLYCTAFIAFFLAQLSVLEPLNRMVVQRGFSLLALALWVHIFMMSRDIIRRLRGKD